MGGKVGGIAFSKMSHGEFAAAPELVVEVFLSEDLAPALLQTALAPVLIPVGGAGVQGSRFERGLSNLIKALPAASCEGCRKAPDAELCGHGGGGPHAHAETQPAAFAAFWIAFVSLDGVAPACVVPVAVRERNGKLFTVADALVLLLFRKYVGIEVVDVRRVVVLQKPFENGGGTGRAAAVQQNGFFHGFGSLAED